MGYFPFGRSQPFRANRSLFLRLSKDLGCRSSDGVDYIFIHARVKQLGRGSYVASFNVLSSRSTIFGGFLNSNLKEVIGKLVRDVKARLCAGLSDSERIQALNGEGRPPMEGRPMITPFCVLLAT